MIAYSSLRLVRLLMLEGTVPLKRFLPSRLFKNIHYNVMNQSLFTEIFNARRWITNTYRTSSVWTNPIVDGMLPLKLFPSRILPKSNHNNQIRNNMKARHWTSIDLQVYQFHIWVKKACRNGPWQPVLIEMTADSTIKRRIIELVNIIFWRITMKQIQSTYKCFVLVRRSRPGDVPDETGSCPLNWLSAKSNQ